ncbi:MAG: hypothetical protein PUP92_11445 [Rhizonema sp. PD38]|nr:hypothetical protein [Rhizonema sp. PD38]
MRHWWRWVRTGVDSFLLKAYCMVSLFGLVELTDNGANARSSTFINERSLDFSCRYEMSDRTCIELINIVMSTNVYCNTTRY